MFGPQQTPAPPAQPGEGGEGGGQRVPEPPAEEGLQSGSPPVLLSVPDLCLPGQQNQPGRDP